MTYKVIRDACIGCGSCVSICEEVFEFDDGGYAVVKEGISLSKETMEQADDAMNSCPTNAIIKEEKIQ